jgi:peptide/nickel transport system permease protein
MFSYITRRLAFGALTVVGVSIVVFVVMRILPGDPLVAIFGPEGFTKLTEEQRAGYMKELGLSDPLFVQCWTWMGEVVRGNLGR